MSSESVPMILVARGPAEARSLGERIYYVIDLAFRRPPHPRVEPRASFLEGWERHLSRADFLLLTIERPGNGAIEGFLYGYRGTPGTWWYDRVCTHLSPEVRSRWFSEAFEVVAMAVVPEAGGRGYGTQMLRGLAARVPNLTLVLTTYRDENPAVRLYVREGFEILHPGLALSAGTPPMLVMGKPPVAGPVPRAPG